MISDDDPISSIHEELSQNHLSEARHEPEKFDRFKEIEVVPFWSGGSNKGREYYSDDELRPGLARLEIQTLNISTR